MVIASIPWRDGNLSKDDPYVHIRLATASHPSLQAHKVTPWLNPGYDLLTIILNLGYLRQRSSLGGISPYAWGGGATEH